MNTHWVCARCLQRLSSRTYSTHHITRDYKGAVQALNTLQSNYVAIQALAKEEPGWHKYGVPKMIQWARRIGYEVCRNSKAQNEV